MAGEARRERNGRLVCLALTDGRTGRAQGTTRSDERLFRFGAATACAAAAEPAACPRGCYTAAGDDPPSPTVTVSAALAAVRGGRHNGRRLCCSGSGGLSTGTPRRAPPTPCPCAPALARACAGSVSAASF